MAFVVWVSLLVFCRFMCFRAICDRRVHVRYVFQWFIFICLTGKG